MLFYAHRINKVFLSVVRGSLMSAVAFIVVLFVVVAYRFDVCWLVFVFCCCCLMFLLIVVC